MSSVQIEVVADLEEVQPRSPEWHRLRRSGIGGSDAGAVCGVSKFKTPYSVWVDKTSEATPAGDDDEPEYMTWGKILETPVREEFSRRTGIGTIPFPRMVRSATYPWMTVNVDALTGTPENIEGVYEGKTSRFDWLEGSEVEVPLEYTVQGMHALAVLDLPVVHFGCLVGGQTLRVAEVERNDTLIADLIAIEEAFWTKYVLGGEAPPLEARDRRVLSQQWTGIPQLEVELDEATVAHIQERSRLCAQIDQLEAKRDECDAAVMRALGEATVGKSNGTVAVTWKPQKRSTIDAEALRKAHPALAAEFTKSSTFRRFLPKEVAR